uniref:Uncharacterized protein n=1 Tax=Rhizophora mucronata TaxID=61149 RepID=A0A2P2QYC8_RHIMU
MNFLDITTDCFVGTLCHPQRESPARLVDQSVIAWDWHEKRRELMGHVRVYWGPEKMIIGVAAGN